MTEWVGLIGLVWLAWKVACGLHLLAAFLISRPTFWRLIHNRHLHPLIGLFGERKLLMRWHDWTGTRWGK